eukprot:CAMPEP_0176242718 /NCGR_PEP_ID=MMETSP0121_2-20121125/30550_1 /TAXON_ID=160619 /ORGANISM="Kryptoperidinium foliaceum, Strain CCMP 1326" /LENGTH=229 /DNA_ID=CAMNT_0017582283 /DNA_START=57 /DNA_END=746 /DNA_ORIENTATION=+
MAKSSGAAAPPIAFVMKRVALITAPMWIAAVMLFFADIKPVPTPDEGPVLPAGVPQDPSSRAAWLEAEIKRARAAAAASERKAAALEEAMKRGPGPMEVALDNLPAQHALAAVAAAAGLLSILGPTTFERFFLALVGSVAGGLMVGASANFLTGYSGTPFWLDAIGMLSNGKGSFFGYFLWTALFVLGMFRWMTGFEYSIYAFGDEDTICERLGEVPLLRNEGEGAVGA